jgi:hypothetical protein
MGPRPTVIRSSSCDNLSLTALSCSGYRERANGLGVAGYILAAPENERPARPWIWLRLTASCCPQSSM